MNKKIVILLVGLLIIVIGATIFLPLFFQRKNQPTPTPGETTSKATDLITSQTDNSQELAVIKKLPVETNDFKIEYSSTQNKIIATKKSPLADQKIDQWLKDNNLSNIKTRPDVFVINDSSADLAGNPEISLTTTPSADNNSSPLIELLSILTNIGSGIKKVDSSLLAGLTISPTQKLVKEKLTPTTKATQPAGKFVYYAQCNGQYDNYPLSSDCTLCQAGCGPTTVAMIAASYVDKNITPKTIVDLYKKKGYFLSCAGSRYSDAKAALASYGLKTTDYLTYSLATIDQAASDFRHYLDSGWTLFILANFCDEGCGHFFWITDMGSGNATWAYDPYYGRNQKPPYDEKSRYPFPKYRIAFGVKK